MRNKLVVVESCEPQRGILLCLSPLLCVRCRSGGGSGSGSFSEKVRFLLVVVKTRLWF